MADVAAPTSVAASPKKAKVASKKPSSKPSHPKTSDMVNAAIKNLKERGGSSLQAIKKYMVSNYKVDAEKLAPFIRKHLKAAVATGALVQTKGKGASGSFKLAKKENDKPKPVAKKVSPKKEVSKDKPKAVAKSKKPAAKKATVTAKKTVAPKKKPAGETVKKPKSPAKAKKTKAPAAKKPKPKKVVAKKASPKKAAPKKK